MAFFLFEKNYENNLFVVDLWEYILYNYVNIC